MSPRECEDGASVISRGPANFRNRRPSRRAETNAGTGEFDPKPSEKFWLDAVIEGLADLAFALHLAGRGMEGLRFLCLGG
jgi:hypothetical protein